jgi:hypothetical protein
MFFYVLLQPNLIIAPVAGGPNVTGRTSAGDRRVPTGEILELSFNIQSSETASRSDNDAVRKRNARFWAAGRQSFHYPDSGNLALDVDTPSGDRLAIGDTKLIELLRAEIRETPLPIWPRGASTNDEGSK